jgi:tetratricopeptide (TPR) repeat protein
VVFADEVVSLASLAARTVVVAAGTDAWEAAKQGFARLFGRGDARRTTLAEGRLDTMCRELTAMPPAEAERARSRLSTTWQTRLLDFLEENPDAFVALSALVEQVRGRMPADTVSAAGHAIAAGRDVAITALDGGVAAGTVYLNAAPGKAYVLRSGESLAEPGTPWITGPGPIIAEYGQTPGGVPRPRTAVAVPPVRLMPQPAFLAGREALLADLHERLSDGDVTSPRMIALCGLAGVGKTSVALAYGHRHLAERGMVWQLPAGEPMALVAGFDDLAAQLGLRELLDARDPVAQVHAALAARAGDWLLIFDNAPSFAALREFLPPAGHGRVLITSQDPHWPGHALDVPVLDQNTATAFMLTRLGSADYAAADHLAADLGGLPAALEQSCAYMEATGRSISEYLTLFQHHKDFLAQADIAGHDRPVAAAWAVTFDRLEHTVPEAISLLRLLACYAPEHIPLKLLLQPRPGLKDSVSPEVAPLLQDPLGVDRAVAALRRYSLISAPVMGMVSVHRLVQAFTVTTLLPSAHADSWQQAARSLIDAALPKDVSQPGAWPACAALLPHLQVTHNPMDKRILSWLARSAPLLVNQAPRAAAELLRPAAASSLTDSTQHDLLMSNFADALYRVGDTAGAEQVSNRALVDAVEPDLIVDMHWTLAQCRLLDGRAAESLVALNHALAIPGISARNRARLLAATARTQAKLGEVQKAGQIAAEAIAAASQTQDNWAIGWALHVLSFVALSDCRFADALALLDRGLTVAQSDPTLDDLRLLLQINKAITLGHLDKYDNAIVTARQARDLADRVGSALRMAQARCALGQLFFDNGRWDEAMAEVQALPPDLKEPGAACCDLGVAAAICLHRGDVSEARRHLATAATYATRVGTVIVGPLALARSLDLEQAGALPNALAVLTTPLTANSEGLEDLDSLLADAVRLAIRIGHDSTAARLTDYAERVAANSEIAHQQANALYCRGLLDHDTARLLGAAERYCDATQPLLNAKALEAAAEAFLYCGGRDRARAIHTRALDTYTSLGAHSDIARLQAGFTAHE